MTTMTDDISPRLTALENRVGNVVERMAALEGQVGELSQWPSRACKEATCGRPTPG